MFCLFLFSWCDFLSLFDISIHFGVFEGGSACFYSSLFFVGEWRVVIFCLHFWLSVFFVFFFWLGLFEEYVGPMLRNISSFEHICCVGLR